MSQMSSSVLAPLPTAFNASTSSKLSAVRDLRCYACSSCPTFTNTSHLLTHLASKVHLRTLFELELCATHRNDKECAQALERFHKWYADERLGEHLVERFIVKRGKWSREKVKVNSDPVEKGVDDDMNDGSRVATKLLGPVEAIGPHSSEVSIGIAPQPDITVQPQKRKWEDDSSAATPSYKHAMGGTIQTPSRSCSDSKAEESHMVPPAPKPRRIRKPVSRMGALVSPCDKTSIRSTSRANSRTASESTAASSGAVTPSPVESVLGEDPFDSLNCREDERAIVDGPDSGVIFSAKGPRLRGKVWPGMGVFDTAITPNARRGSSASTLSIPMTKPGDPLPFAAATAALVKQEPCTESQTGSPSLSPLSALSPSPATPDGNVNTTYFEQIAQEGEVSETTTIGMCGGYGSPVIDIADSDIDADGDYEDDLEYTIRLELPKVYGTGYAQTALGYNSSSRCESSHTSKSTGTTEEIVCHISPLATYRSKPPPLDKHNGYTIGLSKASHTSNVSSHIAKHASMEVKSKGQGTEYEYDRGSLGNAGEVVHFSQQMGLETLNQAYNKPIW